MKNQSQCAVTSLPGCDPAKNQLVQPFPVEPPLSDNLDLSLDTLLGRVGKPTAAAYSYIVRTVTWDEESFVQKGSAPNFQGGVLTLCTCKHQMRAGRDAPAWIGSWLVGFTSRTLLEDQHWLFFLAKIDFAFASHADLWEHLPAKAQRAKAAHRNFLGDVFEPMTPLTTLDGRYDPSSYRAPDEQKHSHSHESNPFGWHNDINYASTRKKRHPSLLLADPKLTFMWTKPSIALQPDHCRDYSKQSLTQLLAKL